jgi:hypothetical protein
MSVSQRTAEHKFSILLGLEYEYFKVILLKPRMLKLF